MYLKQLKVGYLENFEYILADPYERIGTVIDPGFGGKEVDRTIEEASRDGITIKYIIVTHFHQDHIGGVKEMAEKTGAELIVHDDEVHSVGKLGFDCEIVVKDGDLLSLGGLSVRIIHTPGHSPGSICIYTHTKLFTGDTLFVGGCGRADLPRSDPKALYSSLYEKILPLPDSTEVYPGHDYGDVPVSTIGREKENNPYLKCSSLDEFLRLRIG